MPWGRTNLAMDTDSQRTTEWIGDLDTDHQKSQNPEVQETKQTGDGKGPLAHPRLGRSTKILACMPWGRINLAMDTDSWWTAEWIGDLDPDRLKSQNVEVQEPRQIGDGRGSLAYP
uniref:Uncharacterized protein n=1 Tax=Solanum tuberosum TaxID=4113 RepID=M1DJU9_SOLTU